MLSIEIASEYYMYTFLFAGCSRSRVIFQTWPEEN